MDKCTDWQLAFDSSFRFPPQCYQMWQDRHSERPLAKFRKLRMAWFGFFSGVPLASCVLVILYSFHAPLNFQCSPWFQHTTIPRSQIYPIIAKLPPITTNHPPIISKVHAQTPSSHLWNTTSHVMKLLRKSAKLPFSLFPFISPVAPLSSFLFFALASCPGVVS